MGNGIRKLRTKRGLSQAEAAEKLGIKTTELSQFERNWHELPVRLVRDLAILFECSAGDVLGAEVEVTEWKETPYAAGDYSEEEPYGTLGFQIAGRDYDYPISTSAFEGLHRQLRESTPQALEDERGWWSCSTLNNRILFINPSSVRRLWLRSDDEEAMGHFAHPEVYRAMQDWEEGPTDDWGPLLSAAIQEHVEELGEEQAARSVDEARIVFLDGTEADPFYIYEDAVVTALFGLDAHSFHLAQNGMLLHRSEGYYAAEFVNISHVALIDIPREEFLRQSAPED